MRLLVALCACLVAVSACQEISRPAEEEPPPDPLRPEASRVVGLIMSFQTTCALTADGRLHCWGENSFGEFGTGSLGASTVAVPAGGGLLFDFVAGSMGTPQVCGVTRDGVAYCWGYNLNGELGDGTTIPRSSPSRVDASLPFRALASSYHTCGLTTDGVAYCWGSGLGGQLGTGDSASNVRPARVQTSETYTAITNGTQFSCALTSSGSAQCWGWAAGAGGDISDHVYTPAPVSGGHAFRSISAGEEHVCAATPDHAVYCWGKLTPFPDGYRGTPARIPGSVAIVSVVSGSRMLVGGASCGLTDAGDAYCWNGGLAPLQVPEGHRFAGLAGGHGRFCGYTPGGSAFCWSWTRDPSIPGGDAFLTFPQPIPTLAAGP